MTKRKTNKIGKTGRGHFCDSRLPSTTMCECEQTVDMWRGPSCCCFSIWLLILMQSSISPFRLWRPSSGPELHGAARTTASCRPGRAQSAGRNAPNSSIRTSSWTKCGRRSDPPRPRCTTRRTRRRPPARSHRRRWCSSGASWDPSWRSGRAGFD